AEGGRRREAPPPAPAAPLAPPAGNGQPGTVLSPVVRRLAAETGVDLASIPGTGAGGRIRREDVEQAGASAPRPPAPPGAPRRPRGAGRPGHRPGRTAAGYPSRGRGGRRGGQAVPDAADH